MLSVLLFFWGWCLNEINFFTNISMLSFISIFNIIVILGLPGPNGFLITHTYYSLNYLFKSCLYSLKEIFLGIFQWSFQKNFYEYVTFPWAIMIYFLVMPFTFIYYKQKQGYKVIITCSELTIETLKQSVKYVQIGAIDIVWCLYC